ncbi:cell division protein FtsL [Desulfuribacillus stibiiarsenatis]|uniref:Cell division protein FtsL n=1 Tax=Desulfuribacillus stibiiarsenatis TaxID=1390249 RepID=A0A1E5L3N5_9FIRM|nr:cell division protein FtsL [Desulfuribacillus stibiiarsenatis]OEH84704.1 cell division protein FtsL [Desulfuribacillus stibiiarsenatis]
MAYSIQDMKYNQNMFVDTRISSKVGLQSKVGLHTFDKLVVLVFLALSIAASGVLVSKYVIATELTYQKQELQKQIVSYQELNSQLEMKIAELSSPERVYEIAINDIGMMTAPPDKVKIIHRVRVAEVESNYVGIAN